MSREGRDAVGAVICTMEGRERGLWPGRWRAWKQVATAVRNTGLGSGGGAWGVVLGGTRPQIYSRALSGPCAQPPLSLCAGLPGGLAGEVAE